MARIKSAHPRKRSATTTRAFLFSDLRDYTSFVEAKGDAAAARLLREYRTLVRREVARHEGAEVKTEGDSFYVVFDTASTALECAVAILRAAELRDRRDPDAPLRIGVGLHAGETVAYDDQFVGSAVNIASRLAGKAQAMELVISDTLRGLVRTSTSLSMSDRGPLELKGVAEPIRAWTVEWRERAPLPTSPPVAAPVPKPRPPTPRGLLLCPVVVGRRAELDRFAEALSAAIGGAGRTLILGGEAGVGKTAFVREAQERAAGAGCRVLVGLTLQAESGLPYAPFISAVRSGFRGLEHDELGAFLRGSAPDLAELFPELGRITRAELPSSLERHRLTVAFQHLFRAFARQAPLLIVLEDLHWADETSLELLQHLARELRDERVLLLATYRSDEMHRRHPFLRVLAELQRERLVTEISLRRLTPDETKELIRATFAATDPDVTVSDEFRDAIYARSEGSPFFTEELLKALVESGGVFHRGDGGWARKPIGELEIPGSIREAVRARVDRLSADAKQTLSTAAAIGPRFPFELLRTVRGVDESAIEAHIREFIEQQLVGEADDRDDEYAFRHALTREVVYDDLLVRERKRLHRAVAAALEASTTAEPSLLAHHLLEAGESARAVPVLIEAARRAYHASAAREAVTHCARALEIGVPDDELAGVLELQAEAYHFFDAVLSLKAAREAADAYRERDDARGRSRMLRLASRCQWIRGEGADSQLLAREALEAVAADAGSAELGRATAHLAGLRMVDNASDEAIALADRAIEIGRGAHDAWTVANALITKGSATGRTDARRGVALIEEGTKLAQREGLVVTATRGLNNRALWSAVAGASRRETRSNLESALEWARLHGLETAAGGAWLENQLAWNLTAEGDLAGAKAILDEMHARDVRVGRPLAFLIDLLRDGPERHLGEASELIEVGRRAIDAQSYAPAVTFAAGAYLLAGRREEAAAVMREALETMRATGRAPELVTGPGTSVLFALGYALGMPEWQALAAEEVERPTELLRRAYLDLDASHRALWSGELETAARHFLAFASQTRELTLDPLTTLAVLIELSELRRRGVGITPGWRDVAHDRRLWSERARATWATEELAKASESG